MKSVETGPEIPYESREIVGERILGDKDPRDLSQDEFDASPDLLFHGSAEALEFHSGFDYRSQKYLVDNDGSTTLGFGFYTTDSRLDATEYSRVRKFHSDSELNVAGILPYQARVLDLRWNAETRRNAPFPKSLAQAWKRKFIEYLRSRTPRKGNLGALLDGCEAEYGLYLDRALNEKGIDLRVLLETAANVRLGSGNYPSPPWGYLFSDFMLQQGYDGLVYTEGGEGWGGSVASYVFYNLNKVGTFESWQKEKGSLGS